MADLSLTGSLIPTHPAIYEPVLAELESNRLEVSDVTPYQGFT